MKSGLQFQTSAAGTYGFRIDKEVDYELSYVHRKKNLVFKAGIFRFIVNAFNVFVKGNATTKSALSVSKKSASNAPAKVAIGKPSYSVVNVADMQLHAANTVAGSEAEAYSIHDRLIKQNPALKSQLQVVSQFELN